jgi:hypothetical protein
MAVKSRKGKGSYANYKTENRAYKNKIRKLEKHCKKYPEDEVGQKNLERLRDPKNFKHRSKPHNPGTNSPNPQVYRFRPSVEGPKTPAEQLSELLGIPMPKYYRRSKPAKTPVTIKKKRNVKKP